MSPLSGREWHPRDVARLLWDHGWVNANNLMVMTAVIGAESDYYEGAYHVNDDGSTDWGLFELNDQKRKGPALEDFKAKALDATKAVVIARQLYVDRGFQPWAAYSNGSYEKFIPRACIAVANMLAVLHRLEPVV